MNDQSRQELPDDDQGRDAEAGMKAAGTSSQDTRSPEQHGKPRQGYLDPRGSESTREMRDTARRRRDAEEKLQQHLMEAKHHIPNEFHHHEHHGEHGHPAQQDGDTHGVERGEGRGGDVQGDDVQGGEGQASAPEEAPGH